jgi:hypothetical protein
MNTFLETGISLVLIFFIFSIITYVIQELIAVNMKCRSKMLWKSMWQLFDGKELEGRIKLMKELPTTNTTNIDTFYKHPQIKSLKKDLSEKKLPSYIPAANFALAVMDMVAQKKSNKKHNLLDDFRAGLALYPAGNMQTILKNLLDTSSTIKQLQNKIEQWFDSYMKRVTGWYESHTVVFVRLIAVALTLIFNINVIKLAKTIYHDADMRKSLVAMAENIADKPQPVTQYYTSAFTTISAEQDSLFKIKLDADSTLEGKKKILKEKEDTLSALAGRYTQKNMAAMRSLLSQLDSSKVPLGWKDGSFKEEIKGKEGSDSTINFLLMLAGWFIGACCISMGAPFWFDIMNKLVNVRRTVV